MTKKGSKNKSHKRNEQHENDSSRKKRQMTPDKQKLTQNGSKKFDQQTTGSKSNANQKAPVVKSDVDQQAPGSKSKQPTKQKSRSCWLPMCSLFILAAVVVAGGGVIYANEEYRALFEKTVKTDEILVTIQKAYDSFKTQVIDAIVQIRSQMSQSDLDLDEEQRSKREFDSSEGQGQDEERQAEEAVEDVDEEAELMEDVSHVKEEAKETEEDISEDRNQPDESQEPTIAESKEDLGMEPPVRESAEVEQMKVTEDEQMKVAENEQMKVVEDEQTKVTEDEQMKVTEDDLQEIPEAERANQAEVTEQEPLVQVSEPEQNEEIESEAKAPVLEPEHIEVTEPVQKTDSEVDSVVEDEISEPEKLDPEGQISEPEEMEVPEQGEQVSEPEQVQEDIKFNQEPVVNTKVKTTESGDKEETTVSKPEQVLGDEPDPEESIPVEIIEEKTDIGQTELLKQEKEHDKTAKPEKPKSEQLEEQPEKDAEQGQTDVKQTRQAEVTQQDKDTAPPEGDTVSPSESVDTAQPHQVSDTAPEQISEITEQEQLKFKQQNEVPEQTQPKEPLPSKSQTGEGDGKSSEDTQDINDLKIMIESMLDNEEDSDEEDFDSGVKYPDEEDFDIEVKYSDDDDDAEPAPSPPVVETEPKEPIRDDVTIGVDTVEPIRTDVTNEEIKEPSAEIVPEKVEQVKTDISEKDLHTESVTDKVDTVEPIKPEITDEDTHKTIAETVTGKVDTFEPIKTDTGKTDKDIHKPITETVTVKMDTVEPIKTDNTGKKPMTEAVTEEVGNIDLEPVKEDISDIVNDIDIQEGKMSEASVDDTKEPSESDKKEDVADREETKTDEKVISEKEEQKMKKAQEKAAYPKLHLTNSRDYRNRKRLDSADELEAEGDLEAALVKYEKVLEKYPSSPRANYGKGIVLNKMAEKKQSNRLLDQAISSLDQLLNVPDVPDQLLILAGRLLAERQQFRGWSEKASKTWRHLVEKFPEDYNMRNQLGVSYILIGEMEAAKNTFSEVLSWNPDDGFAKVHLGFILKTSDLNIKEAIPLLEEGIETEDPGTEDGRFYFHLGEALQRINKTEQAYKWYQRGAAKGLFLSAYQRSLYNVWTLTSRPWWTQQQTGYTRHFKLLEENWKVIRDEGLALLNSETHTFLPEEENLRETGEWKQLTLYNRGRKDKNNCDRAPKTCELIDKIPDAKGCRRGQVKFSVMLPGVHVWPHCGPTNCRLRSHLGLVVPPGPRIRVANETRLWEEGKVFVFDDSFEHEVWHEGSKPRLVLIVDFWHPDLDKQTKAGLTAI